MPDPVVPETIVCWVASAHPDYAAYERPADDVHIVGKVLWKVTRA